MDVIDTLPGSSETGGARAEMEMPLANLGPLSIKYPAWGRTWSKRFCRLARQSLDPELRNPQLYPTFTEMGRGRQLRVLGGGQGGEGLELRRGDERGSWSVAREGAGEGFFCSDEEGALLLLMVVMTPLPPRMYVAMQKKTTCTYRSLAASPGLGKELARPGVPLFLFFSRPVLSPVPNPVTSQIPAKVPAQTLAVSH